MVTDKVVPFFDHQGVIVLRMLTDNGTGFCGTSEHHKYDRYLNLEKSEQTRTKAEAVLSKGCNQKTPINTFFKSAPVSKKLLSLCSAPDRQSTGCQKKSRLLQLRFKTDCLSSVKALCDL